MEKYFVVMAVDVEGYEQSDYLCLITVEDGEVIGYAAEFDSCTKDIGMACDASQTHKAKWFAWNDEWRWRPATMHEIKLSNLEGYLIGTKSDMRLSTPIDPL